MRLLEYQGKELFAAAGIPVPQGQVAQTVDEAVAIMRAHPAPSVVKAQVLIGGRGKAGGIKFANDERDVVEPAKAILGMNIKGETAKRIWIEQRVDIVKELYLSITVDRQSKRPIIIASAMGGMDIEEVAATHSDIFPALDRVAQTNAVLTDIDILLHDNGTRFFRDRSACKHSDRFARTNTQFKVRPCRLLAGYLQGSAGMALFRAHRIPIDRRIIEPR